MVGTAVVVLITLVVTLALALAAFDVLASELGASVTPVGWWARGRRGSMADLVVIRAAVVKLSAIRVTLTLADAAFDVFAPKTLAAASVALAAATTPTCCIPHHIISRRCAPPYPG